MAGMFKGEAFKTEIQEWKHRHEVMKSTDGKEKEG
jgi:hypothetical protein